MKLFHENVTGYKKQLKKGATQVDYTGSMEYAMGLRTYFEKKYPDHFVSGSIYYGYMDMTYFSFIPKLLKQRKLKPAIVFVHDKFGFEIWLSASNKQVQQKYWDLIKESGWNKYSLVPTTQGYDSIIEHTLVDDPDFSDLDALTKQIEKSTLKFIKDVENFLSKH